VAQVKLESNTRENSGKGVARKLRAAGRIPGVLYGPTIEPIRLDLQEKALAELVNKYGLNPIINLSVGSESHLCMIKDIQRDVFQTRMLHLDLRKIDLKEKIEVNVPLHFEGEEGVNAVGLVVEQTVRHVRVKTTPAAIPEQFTVDVSKLRVGKTIHISEIKMPEGVELAQEDTSVVHIFAPRGTVVAAEEDAG
jgi:large subunit ribosomal protein L25